MFSHLFGSSPEGFSMLYLIALIFFKRLFSCNIFSSSLCYMIYSNALTFFLQQDHICSACLELLAFSTTSSACSVIDSIHQLFPRDVCCRFINSNLSVLLLPPIFFGSNLEGFYGHSLFKFPLYICRSCFFYL